MRGSERLGHPSAWDGPVSAQPVPQSLSDLPALVRARDLKALGLTRTDAERVMHLAGTYQLGKAVYARRADVERVLAAAKTQEFA